MLSTSTLIARIRDEYNALPGLKLTREQACRLWAVDDDTCGAAMEALIDEGFLHRTGTGKFIALPRPAGTSVRVDDLARTAGPVRCPHCQKLNTIALGENHGAAGLSIRCVACRQLITFTALSA